MTLSKEELNNFKNVQAAYFDKENQSIETKGDDMANEAGIIKKEVINNSRMDEKTKEETLKMLNKTISLIEMTNECINPHYSSAL